MVKETEIENYFDDTINLIELAFAMGILFIPQTYKFDINRLDEEERKPYIAECYNLFQTWVLDNKIISIDDYYNYFKEFNDYVISLK